MIRRITVALVALVAGLAVAAGLLVYDRAGQASAEVYVASVDLPAGARMSGAAVRPARAILDGRQAALAYRSGEEARLGATVAAHDLTAGQIIQRSDTVLPGRDAARALVVVPLKDGPPLRPGDHVDLMTVSGSGDALTVALFAPGVAVHSVSPSGIVLDVAAPQAPGFVYAAAALHLVAIEVGSALRTAERPPEEATVSSSAQARAVARR